MGFESSVNNSSVVIVWGTEKRNLPLNPILTNLLSFCTPGHHCPLGKYESEDQKESVGHIFFGILKLNK